MGLDGDMRGRLEEWCERQGVELLFKFHPVEHGTAEIHGRHLHLCAPASDVYPLMPMASGLVTDYSFACVDALLLDKPVLFLAADADGYHRRDRQFQCGCVARTPEPKSSSWAQVPAALEKQ